MRRIYPRINNKTRKVRISSGLEVKAWQKYLLGLVILVACAVPLREQWPKILPIKRVEIAGEFMHLAPSELETRATDAIRGGFVSVSVAAIKQELVQEEWISNVAVRRVWPDSLMIYITEHEPVALWNEGSLLSSDGTLFTPPQDSFPAGLPALNGPRGSERAVLQKYQLLTKELAQQNLVLDALTLTERRAWQFSLINGPVVLLGRKNLTGRFQRFFDFAIPYQADRLSQATSIDMRYTNGFAVKWAQESNGKFSG